MYSLLQNLWCHLKKRISRIQISQVVIAFCVIVLALWCAYNMGQIYFKFISRDTIISLENVRPTNTEFPGITICAPSIFKPQMLAELFPDTFGKSMNEFKRWRIKNHGADDPTGPKRRLNELLQYETWAVGNFSALEIIQNYSVRFEDLIISCEYVPINIRKLHTFRETDGLVPKTYPCTDIVSAMESIYESKKCITFFSRIPTKKDPIDNGTYLDRGKDIPHRPPFKPRPNVDDDVEKENNISEIISGPLYGPDKSDGQVEGDPLNDGINAEMRRAKEGMVFDLNPSIEIRLKSVESDIWSDYLNGNSIVMTVHPPNILQSRRDFLFFQVTKNTFNEITFTKKTTVLIANEKVNCVDYKTDSLFSHYKTRDNCISLCVNWGKSTDCANFYGALSLETFKIPEYSKKKICQENDYAWYLKKRSYCEQKCKQECVKTIFEVSGQMRNTLLESPCSDNWWDGYDEGDEVDEDEQSEGNGTSSSELYNNFAFQEAPIHEEDADAQWQQSFMRTIVQKTAYMPMQSLNRPVEKSSPVSLKQKRIKRSIFDSWNDDTLTYCEAQVSIRISPKPWTKVEHHPSITKESFIGTIGGHLGIWLGLSLYKIIKFAVQTAYHLLYRIIQNCSESFDFNMCHQ